MGTPCRQTDRGTALCPRTGHCRPASGPRDSCSPPHTCCPGRSPCFRPGCGRCERTDSHTPGTPDHLDTAGLSPTNEGRKEMFYLTTHSTHFIYGSMASDIWLRTILIVKETEREMFYLTTHSTHFIYGSMASDIWLRTILIVRKEARCHHIGYSYQLAARVILYASSHRQDNTYHSLCYTSRGALAGMRNSSIGSPHEGSIRRPITP